MKHFVLYTVLRIALFVACWGVLAGIGTLAFGSDTRVGIWTFMLAAVLTFFLSYWVLAGPRERFARSVQERAERATARFEELKTREDADGS